ncbi:hypothetical protein L210DRAFT_3508983 [Boletus edulis BED1]|uniref:Uncharacterized protein n=1 Tax=Boletus edulis BED1 TaxID=1328754 RepID=A0AAD4BGI6_BOLED|nr:hypothetical protein L210DRAFT_3508983 [Boletus edulis BED1]
MKNWNPLHRTLLDSNWEDKALLSGTHHSLDPAIPFVTLPTHFQSILYAEANAWTILTQDCVIALVNNIICNRLSLNSLVDTALILRVETVTSTITSVIDWHRRAGIQVLSYVVPDLGNIALQPGNHGYAFLVVRGLQTVPYAYLSQEITQLPTQPNDIFLFHPAELCIGEEIAFCLAWVSAEHDEHRAALVALCEVTAC